MKLCFLGERYSALKKRSLRLPPSAVKLTMRLTIEWKRLLLIILLVSTNKSEILKLENALAERKV